MRNKALTSVATLLGFFLYDCCCICLQFLCGTCHPFAGHLYERLGTAMTITNEFCAELTAECADQLNLNEDFCDYHTGGGEDQFWSYPLVIEEGTQACRAGNWRFSSCHLQPR